MRVMRSRGCMVEPVHAACCMMVLHKVPTLMVTISVGILEVQLAFACMCASVRARLCWREWMNG
jgi:hypothetical protein